MKRFLQISIVAVGLVTATVGNAQDGHSWNWSVTPYGWLSGLDGEITVGPVSAPVDLSFSDVLEDLDFAAMLAVDGNNGNWGVHGDMFYANLSSSLSTAAGKVKSDLEQWIVSVAPYLRVRSDDKAIVDVGAGGRYLALDTDLRTPVGNGSRSVNWIDPVVMARVQVPLSANWSMSLNGDIGGFGIESDFTWQISASAGYSMTKNTDVVIGYRYLDVDYEKDGFGYDMATSGFGAGIRISL